MTLASSRPDCPACRASVRFDLLREGGGDFSQLLDGDEQRPERLLCLRSRVKHGVRLVQVLADRSKLAARVIHARNGGGRR